MPKLCCPLCGQLESRLVKREAEWKIVECLKCTFVFVTPVPDEQFLFRHYQQYLPSEKNRIEEWRKMMLSIFLRSLDAIESRNFIHRGTLLDIGCGYGFFLEMARQRGWCVSGIEPCLHARKYAELNGIKIDSGSLFERGYQDETFDAVTAFYVLEHLPDPLKYLKEINRILKPGGLLLVRLPHTTPLVKFLKILKISNGLYDVPSHLSDFSPHTISLALNKSGFNEIHTFPGGSTRPTPISQRIVSYSSGLLADIFYNVSGQKLLMPGVSKTTIATKIKSKDA